MKTKEQITIEINEVLVPYINAGADLAEVIGETIMEELGSPEEEIQELRGVIAQARTMIALMAKVYTNPKVVDKIIEFMDKSEQVKSIYEKAKAS